MLKPAIKIVGTIIRFFKRLRLVNIFFMTETFKY